MKPKLRIVIIALLAFRDSDAAEQLEIKGLRTTYPADAAIEFQIINKSAGAVTFACAAEKLIDDRFQECRWDIFQNVMKVGFRKPREVGGEAVRMRWDTPKQMKVIRPEAGSAHRLRIDVLSPRAEYIFTHQFSITRASNQRVLTNRLPGPNSKGQ